VLRPGCGLLEALLAGLREQLAAWPLELAVSAGNPCRGLHGRLSVVEQAWYGVPRVHIVGLVSAGRRRTSDSVFLVRVGKLTTAGKPLWLTKGDQGCHHIFFDDNIKNHPEKSIVGGQRLLRCCTPLSHVHWLTQAPDPHCGLTAWPVGWRSTDAQLQGPCGCLPAAGRPGHSRAARRAPRAGADHRPHYG
jgi:hypothetical protein